VIRGLYSENIYASSSMLTLLRWKVLAASGHSGYPATQGGMLYSERGDRFLEIIMLLWSFVAHYLGESQPR
jgi:hypothetical protein